MRNVAVHVTLNAVARVMLVGKTRRNCDSVDDLLCSDVLLPEASLLLRLETSAQLAQVDLVDGRE